jgi:hypothetical protein
MTEMIFDTSQRLEGHGRCSVVRDLIVERWQTIFYDPSTLRYHNHFGTLCTIKQDVLVSLSDNCYLQETRIHSILIIKIPHFAL